MPARNDVLTRWTYRYPFNHQSQTRLDPVSTWRGEPKENVGCSWKVLPHFVTWVCVGRGMPHAKAYKKYTMALLFRRINEFKKNKTRVLHQYHLILRSNRNEQKTHVIHLLNANPVGFRPHVQLQLWLVPQVVQGWSVFCAGLSHSKRSLSHCHHKSNELARGTGKLSISTKN